MKEPNAPFLNSLAMVWNGVVSYAAAAKYGKDFRNHPVGTGPFIFREWKARDQIVLDANPNYWKGKPKIDHIVFKEYPDPQAALLALQARRDADHGRRRDAGDPGRCKGDHEHRAADAARPDGERHRRCRTRWRRSPTSGCARR